MLSEPYVIAGADRLDTAVMEAWPGRVIAKTGAEGVYSAAIPELALGLAIKVADGDSKAATLALVAVLEQVTARFGAGGKWPLDTLDHWRSPAIRNTRGVPTGRYEVRGELCMTERGAALDGPSCAPIGLAAAIAKGDEQQLRAQVELVRAARKSSIWVDELLLQSVLMVGWPRTLGAAALWRGWPVNWPPTAARVTIWTTRRMPSGRDGARRSAARSMVAITTSFATTCAPFIQPSTRGW